MAREGLTPKQEAFAQGVADGLSLAESFRRANPNALKWKDKTVWENASRLMADSKVSARLSDIRSQLAAKHLWTRAQSVEVLSGIAEAGEKDADRVRAVSELNAMHGYDAPQKLDITNSDGSLRPNLIQIVAKQ
jgi:phage terminase small subunit